MDERDKEAQRARHLRAQKKWIGHEEARRRKAEARQRRAERGHAPTRQRGWAADLPRDDDDDDRDEVGFEKIRRPPPVRSHGGRLAPDELARLPRGLVVAVHRGRVCLDGGRDGRLAGALAADPTFQLAVGDEVALADTEGTARIVARLPRRSVLARPDPGHPARELVLAANVDVGVVVVSAQAPPLRPGLIDRMLLALERGGVAATVCLNKADLLADPREHAAVLRALSPYEELGVPLFACSAAAGEGLDALRAHLAGRTCVFVGHSGVGKSSILNALDPDGGRRVGAVRDDDGKGRHTTTSASLRTLADGTRVIDTPGVRAFGLDGLAPEDLARGFPELMVFARTCRHRDCTHVHEPGCAVRDAAERGHLPRARYESYLRIAADP